ncbi:helix-turn-helix domain-containing protein [Kitasatospora sp. CM 4170]|uniref:Helix-turn-helix domain-containing protein n=1 Tax=Kitasatospora aburaviensis TaxID=67265 RepID=A0ABW1F2Q4_9ACTN|nr:helix-turn-helix domain-containing protein [Kitasatospora sp. CM 4170]WNM47406.1 helix-turn-helix domain-containing protein [Kitasatospora sp. CM 4170]
MRAKTEQREAARRLRAQGRTYDEIQAELGVSKSSISLWVRDLPAPRPSQERMRKASEARWGPLRRQREEERRATKAAAAAEIGPMSDDRLFLIGVALYWAEGCKDKPYDRREKATFINSDPGVVLVYLAWLRMLGVSEERWRLRVSIHESADVSGAEHFWSEVAGVPVERFQRATLKRHNPKTVRKNVDERYRGCLVVSVLSSAELYRRIEGWWIGIVDTQRRPHSGRV